MPPTPYYIPALLRTYLAATTAAYETLQVCQRLVNLELLYFQHDMSFYFVRDNFESIYLPIE